MCLSFCITGLFHGQDGVQRSSRDSALNVTETGPFEQLAIFHEAYVPYLRCKPAYSATATERTRGPDLSSCKSFSASRSPPPAGRRW